MSNNIEQKIKKEFNSRKINPSHNAWEILDAKLDTKKAEKRQSKFVYLSYVAIFIGLLFGLLFFMNTSNKIDILDDKETVIVVKKTDSLKTAPVLVATSNKKNKPILKPIIKKLLKSDKTNITHVLRKKKEVKSNVVVAKSNVVYTDKVIVESANTSSNVLLKTAINAAVTTEIASNMDKMSLKEPKEDEIKIKNSFATLQSTDADIEAMLAKEMATYKQDTSHGFTINEDDLMLYSSHREEEFQFRNKVKQIFIAGVDTVEEFVTNNN